MSRSNIFDSVNSQIFDFVRQHANRSLIPGTGSYSALFRGSLFGESRTNAVAAQLKNRTVDALWLGANPNCPLSIANILDSRCGEGDFPDFETQMASGLFSSRRWDEQGHPSLGWNPLEKPRGGWIVYRDILKALFGSVECVTMANFLPWGSKNTNEFVSKLGGAKPELLKRALRFADEINAEIVSAIKPKLILVPYSFGMNSKIDKVHLTGVSMARATECRERCIETVQGAFTLRIGMCRPKVPIVYVRHPASLRLRNETARVLVNKVPKILAKFC